MRVLFVSAQFPEDLSRSVSGAFQRMRMWLDAMQSCGAELEVLFLTESTVDTSRESAARAARRLADEWKIECSVVLCPREAPQGEGRLVERYLAPMLSSRGTGVPRPLRPKAAGGPGRCLGRSPDVVVFFYLHGIMPLTRGSRARGCCSTFRTSSTRSSARSDAAAVAAAQPLRYLWVPALWWASARPSRASRPPTCARRKSGAICAGAWASTTWR